MSLSRPQWGLKRICATCNARFYDLGKQPIVCPKCHAEFDIELLLKKRRGRPATPEAKILPLVPGLEDPLHIDLEEELEVLEESDDVLEDTSDFGDEDEAVVAIEHVSSED